MWSCVLAHVSTRTVERPLNIRKVIMSNCFWCKESVSRIALTDLVYTWEIFKVGDNLELKEVSWHKACYKAAQCEDNEQCYCGHPKSMHDSDCDERQEKFWCNGKDCDCGRFILLTQTN